MSHYIYKYKHDQQNYFLNAYLIFIFSVSFVYRLVHSVISAEALAMNVIYEKLYKITLYININMLFSFVFFVL